MTVEVVARARVGSIEGLVCHPRLPLIAALATERPAVHIWDGEGLDNLATIGGDTAEYADADYGLERIRRTPAIAWHPDQPLLVVSAEHGGLQWTHEGVAELPAVPPTAIYQNVAFSPDGQRLWASPSSSDGEDTDWERSDVIDLATGTIGTNRWWDTGVAVHPAGGLVATLCSDQGATLCVFARSNGAMRMLRHALILDADSYQTPIFSADGSHLAIRGNAYENSLEVFEFPSLRRVLATVLGDPYPGYPCPDEWNEQYFAWSRPNVAFGTDPGTLWVATPAGTLIEVDIDNRRAIEHDLLDGDPATALAATATGQLVVTSGAGDLVLVAPDSAATVNPDAERVRAFLAATSEVPDEGVLDDHLVLIEGTRVWDPEDRASVRTATDTDPSWLQLTAAINNARES